MNTNRLLWTILVIAVSCCVLSVTASAQTSTQTYTYSYNGKPLPIFINDANIITLVYIPVPRSTQIQDVKVTVDIDYPRIGDLNVFLYSPANTRTKLLERNCGDNATLRNTTFDDSAPGRYSDACPSAAGGSFRGNEPLANSRGENGAGLWVLAVENNGSNDTFGWVVGYSVTITGLVYSSPTIGPDLIVNAASLAGGGVVAPGELVSIFGTNLGPNTPVEATTPSLPLTLGGTTASFNQFQLPIRYASKYRVDVQVPYALGIPGDGWFSVQYGGATSNGVNRSIVTARPGLFTINRSGLGQLDATNADGTANRDQPAARGTEITVYASGLGVTVPMLTEGQAPPANPPAQVYNPVTASVGGLQATVTQAFLTPDKPGLYTVKIMIPNNLAVGNADVIISTVSNSSQDGAYIRVR